MKFDKIKNIRDYTLGPRPFSTTVLIATTFATAISAHKTIGSVGKAYSMGIVFILSMFLIPVGWFIMARLLAKNLQFFHHKKFLTLGDIMEYWYGKAGRWLTSVCAIAFTLGMTAASSMAIGALLHYFFGVPETIGMLVALAIVTLYSAFGGVQAVAFTDVFQFLIFFIALPVACAIGYNNVGGYENIISALPKSHLTIDAESISLFLGMAGFALMPNADIPFIQRAFAARNSHQLRTVFSTVAILMLPLFIIIALIGLITYIQNPNVGPDIALYYFVSNYLPAGVIGLMITGILAIVMSTQDSFLNTTSTLIARDICKQVWPSINDRQELLIARISCVTISLMSVGLLFIKKDILDLIWFITNFWDPLIIVPFLGCLIGLKINKKLFFFLPIAVLTAELITKQVTGVFDSRSFTVGIIVSAITLFIFSKIGNAPSKNKLYSWFPSKNLLVMLYSIIHQDHFKITDAFKFSILIIFGFFVSIFFNPLLAVPAQDSVFYLNATGAALCLMLLLSEIWMPDNHEKMFRYFWCFILFFCLPFLYTYTLVRSEYYFSWIINFILSTILLYCITSRQIFFITFIPGILLGFTGGTLLNHYIPPNPKPPHPLFDYNFAIYSGAFLSLVIALLIHNRLYIQKQLYVLVEKEVLNRTKELKQALEVKKEFLDNVSHEIKTPIHNITNIVSELYDQWNKLKNKEKQELVKTLKSCNHMLLTLCSNLLDLSKFKEGKKGLKIVQCNISELIKEIMQEHSYAQHSILIRISPNLPQTVYCDHSQILQVMRNLVDNAVKYGEGSSIIIEAVNIENKYIRVSVLDEGQGIPKREIKKIFETFEQSSQTKTRAGGTGLGLAICKKIIEMHKGSIVAKNNKFGGATLSFTIPIRSSEYEEIKNTA